MNDFSIGKGGGGNLGFAIDCRTQLLITRTEGGHCYRFGNAGASFACLLEYALACWGKSTGDDSAYDVTLEACFPEHVGLASSAAVQSAVYIALNWMNGLPLTEHDLWHLTVQNYRELNEGTLQQGFTTGLSYVLNCYGGFSLVDSKTDYPIKIDVPRWPYAFATLRDVPRGVSFGVNELEALTGQGRRFDQRDGQQKRTLIYSDLLPALSKPDLKKAGDSIRVLQRLGGKKAELALYQGVAENVLEKLAQIGVPLSFMSALGPGVVCIGENETALVDMVERTDLDIIYTGHVDRFGVILSPA